MGANDRYQVVSAPPMAPGCCFVCKSNSRGPFVDTRVDDPYLGVFYICLGCHKDMAVAFGETENASLEEQIEDKLSEARAAGFADGLKSAKDALNEYVGLLSSGDFADPPYLSDGAVVLSPEAVQIDSPREGGSGEGSDSTGKQVKRSDSKQGRDDVPGNSGNGSAGLELPDITL